MSKNALIKGTVILTLAGFITRILGFFYRIWLSGNMGVEVLGIYQMIFPVYGVCFTVYASGIQTAISKLAAESEHYLPPTVIKSKAASHLASARLVFRSGLFLSFSLALLLSLLLYETAPFLAEHFLFEKRAGDALRILSFVFPFCSITACINGYYYGRSKSVVPAFTQMLEQMIRIASVFLLFHFSQAKQLSCELAVLGLIAGEAASALFNLVSLFFEQKAPSSDFSEKKSVITAKALGKVGALAFPLSFNRLVVSLLHSLEATMVPFMFRKYGMTTADSLGHYGIINGMSIPFLMFPTAITSALSVLLLPTVSFANAAGQKEKLRSTIFLATKFSLLLGALSTALFLIFGYDLGLTVFQEPRSGAYLQILAWLCPFLYLSSTYTSILNGLGKPYQTFLNSVIGMCIKIAVIFFVVPRFGLFGYFLSLLCSQIVITILDGLLLYKMVGTNCLPGIYFLKAVLILSIFALIILPLYQYGKSSFSSSYLALACYGGAYVVCVLLSLVLSRTVSLKELSSFRK